MRKDSYKITPTAIFCARIRASHTKMPYAKEIYAQLDSDLKNSDLKIFPPWLRYLFLHISGFKKKISLLESRFLSTNDAIKKLGKNVGILELASGLSTRGLEMASQSPYYIESDLKVMIEDKKNIIKKIKDKKNEKIPDNYYFETVNPFYYQDLEKVGKIIKNYPKDIPIAIIQEGLFTYLNKSEQELVRDNIYNFLKKYNPNGAWISTDFSHRISKPSKILQYVMKRTSKKTRSKLSEFKSDEEVKEFLSKGNLIVKFIPNEDIAKQLSCNKILGLSNKDAIEEAKHSRAAFITLK